MTHILSATPAVTAGAEHELAQELLRDDPGAAHDALGAGRARVFAPGAALLVAAQTGGGRRSCAAAGSGNADDLAADLTRSLFAIPRFC